ncbi:MAG: hypothetical protein C6Y22_25735 [Hapalosiphonaceae cyanobacterium JJU2]|nr:MAG: hypothetical protein C6Y22_25735 [Hapalosiphonaceae cyanobacterium JJU2]
MRVRQSLQVGKPAQRAGSQNALSPKSTSPGDRNSYNFLARVAPPNSWIVRYQVKGKYGIYWYYKLQSEQPEFPTKDNRGKSRYKHLGKAGSPAYNEAITSMVRRAKIDALSRVINTIKQGWIDLYDETEKNQNN